MCFPRHLAKVKFLDKIPKTVKKKDFVIVGSACLVLYGLLKENRDLDLWTTPEVKEIINESCRDVFSCSELLEEAEIHVSSLLLDRVVYGSLPESDILTVEDYQFLSPDALLSFYDLLVHSPSVTPEQRKKYSQRVELLRQGDIFTCSCKDGGCICK